MESLERSTPWQRAGEAAAEMNRGGWSGIEMAAKGQKKVIYVLNMKRLISFLPPDAVDSPVAAAHWFGPTAEMCVCVRARVPSRTQSFLGIAPECATFVSLPLIIFLFVIFFCFLYSC